MLWMATGGYRVGYRMLVVVVIYRCVGLLGGSVLGNMGKYSHLSERVGAFGHYHWIFSVHIVTNPAYIIDIAPISKVIVSARWSNLTTPERSLFPSPAS